jgi:hypothetical protein
VSTPLQFSSSQCLRIQKTAVFNPDIGYEGEDLLKNQVCERILSRARLPFNIENIDGLFPGFALGNFAVLHGSSAVQSLASLLCVRAQLPYQFGGLESNVLFVDGGNSFRLYDISNIAQLHELEPRKILERIFVSRAFTAYQLTSTIFDRLHDAVREYESKLVVLSDLARFYLDKDVPKREAKDVFSQLTAFIRDFAQENRVIVIATYFPHFRSKRNKFFKEMIFARANVVASVKRSRYGRQFVLEKHPFLRLGKADFPSENLTLAEFLGA